MSCFTSLSALIENRIFNVHGGLSPSIQTLDQVGDMVNIVVSLVSFEVQTSEVILIRLG
jgi:hypothetical protein